MVPQNSSETFPRMYEREWVTLAAFTNWAMADQLLEKTHSVEFIYHAKL